MIHAVTVTNYLGDSIRMELAYPEKSGFAVAYIGGIGPGKANINTTEVATNDGSLYNSARLPSRNITIGLVYVEDPETARHKSYKYFPLKRDVKLLFETDTRTVEISGRVEANEVGIFSSGEGSDISIICPDPYFYSAGEAGNSVTDFYSIFSLFEFPFSNESLTENLIEFGRIEIKTEDVIVYPGDAEIGVMIYIHALGPATNIKIFDMDSRKVMAIDTDKLKALTGEGIIRSDDIIINTSKGKKSITLIREGTSYNILNCLDKNTDWLTLSKGDNVFAFTADSGVTNLQFRVENKIIYEGL